MSKHTPGPWTMYALEPGVEINAATRDGIALVCLDDTDEDALAETQANAGLIAAAPIMLQEINRLRNELALIYRKISHGCTDANCKVCGD